MPLPDFEMLTPRTLPRAVRLLSQGDGIAALAGGTDLLVAMKQGLKAPERLADLSGLAALRQICHLPDSGLRIGSMVTLRSLSAHGALRDHYLALWQAALAVGSPQLRAMGTLGGNLCQDACCLYYNRPPMQRLMLATCFKLGGDLCHVVPTSRTCRATYSGDTAAALLALGAHVEVAASGGAAVRPLADLFTGDGRRPIALGAGEVVTAVILPAPVAGMGSAYFKFRLRQTIDYPLLGVAAAVRIRDGRCESVRVGLTAVERAPVLLDVSELAGGRVLDEEMTDEIGRCARALAHPVANVSEVTPAYRRDMVPVLVKRALNAAVAAAAGGLS